MSNPPIDQHYAYPTEFTDIEAVMRLSAVKRWHMIETFKTQTLAEHSANVAMLVYVVAVSAPGMYFGAALPLAGAALLHDVPEVFIGDIPTHSKRWFASMVQQAEAAVTPKSLVMTPSPTEKLLIKICDLVDGIRFIRIHGTDITGRHAMEGLELQLWQKYLQAANNWPPEVYVHVLEKSWFYAYEARDRTASAVIGRDVWTVADDLARGPGNQPGGPGPVVRDERRKS